MWLKTAAIAATLWWMLALGQWCYAGDHGDTQLFLLNQKVEQLTAEVEWTNRILSAILQEVAKLNQQPNPPKGSVKIPIEK